MHLTSAPMRGALFLTSGVSMNQLQNGLKKLPKLIAVTMIHSDPCPTLTPTLTPYGPLALLGNDGDLRENRCQRRGLHGGNCPPMPEKEVRPCTGRVRATDPPHRQPRLHNPGCTLAIWERMPSTIVVCEFALPWFTLVQCLFLSLLFGTVHGGHTIKVQR